MTVRDAQGGFVRQESELERARMGECGCDLSVERCHDHATDVVVAFDYVEAMGVIAALRAVIDASPIGPPAALIAAEGKIVGASRDPRVVAARAADDAMSQEEGGT